MQPTTPPEPTTHKPKLAELLIQALALFEGAIEEARVELVKQGDNPKIDRRFPNAPNVFVISSSVLGANQKWDPFAHDWVAQYRYAADLLQTRRFAALEKLLEGSGYRDASHGMRTFAPEVIERIKAITGDLRLAVQDTGGNSYVQAATTVARRARTAP